MLNLILNKRSVIDLIKRQRRLTRNRLESSEARISFFKHKLQEKRISFIEDSIPLVIEREKVVEDTINMIQSTDGFDWHKEIKIFFVGEEAQDAGGVLKEWIF